MAEPAEAPEAGSWDGAWGLVCLLFSEGGGRLSPVLTWLSSVGVCVLPPLLLRTQSHCTGATLGTKLGHITPFTPQLQVQDR